MKSDKKCGCGHFKEEHMLIQKDVSNFHILVTPDMFMTAQEGRGECKKCLCPEFVTPSKFNPRYGVEYPLQKISEGDLEERCTRCGRLLSNHHGDDVGHPFHYAKKTPM